VSKKSNLEGASSPRFFVRKMRSLSGQSGLEKTIKESLPADCGQAKWCRKRETEGPAYLGNMRATSQERMLVGSLFRIGAEAPQEESAGKEPSSAT